MPKLDHRHSGLGQIYLKSFLWHAQLIHNSGPPTACQRYAIKWHIYGGLLVAEQCVLAGCNASPSFILMESVHI